MTKAIGGIGLILVLSYARLPLFPFILLSALCGALVATQSRAAGETYVTREADNIFGVRIDQLQSLMLVALRKEMLALTDRVAALEAA